MRGARTEKEIDSGVLILYFFLSSRPLDEELWCHRRSFGEIGSTYFPVLRSHLALMGTVRMLALCWRRRDPEFVQGRQPRSNPPFSLLGV